MLTRRAFLATPVAASLSAQQRRPNIIFILADDLGWRDTSVYGSNFYETPNIDRLAARGMRFTQAYAAAPICSPTRASILTGLYPARLGFTTPAGHLPQVILEQTLSPKAQPHHKALTPNSITRLKQDYVTLAETLKSAGYRTAHFGKWHLGSEPYDALHQGFDQDTPHFPGPGPAGGYLGGPWKFWPSQGKPGEHIEDRMAEEAERFIAANKGGPFYVNYWAFSVHSPWQAKPELVAKYARKVELTDPQHNPVAGAMVESLDQAVGRLMKAVDEAGLANNTIFVFFSDNGGVFWNPGKPGMMHPEYENTPVTSNAPLRAGKATSYEGGSREPCIVVWPGKTKPGAVSSVIIQSIDFYPTLLTMAGVAHPGHKIDGVSFVPALEGRSHDRGPVFLHFPHYTPVTGGRPATYVRRGDWKLIRFWCDNEDQTDRFELYNLRDDLSETRNLARANPAKVAELNTLIEGFLGGTKAVVPKPNPGYSYASRSN